MEKRTRAATAGSLAAMAAFGASELTAGLLGSVPSLVESIGDVIVDTVPTPIKDWAIAVFGVYDKLALIIGIIAVGLLVGAVVGLLAAGKRWVGPFVFVVFGVAGVAAAVSQGESLLGSVVGAAVAVAVGVVVLDFLLERAERPSPEMDESRRRFLVTAGATVVVVALAAGTGRMLIGRSRRLAARRGAVDLPSPVEAAPAPAPEMQMDVEGLSSLVTSNSDFYRIDTALSIPQVDIETWTLKITGMVDRPYEMDFEELLAMDMVERYVTLSCVSNRVGGDLVGNAKWLGVPLSAVLDRAGVIPGASQVVGRAVDGFTVGFPTQAVYDGREALVAVGMNGEPLPAEHGFPARLVVAGLYGYVSATKWLAEIELTTWDDFDAYWVPRGWSKVGPVKTQSRIDTPRSGEQIGTEPRAIAGVAWAPNVGIERVEVQIDDQAWVEAELAESLADDSWRQWKLDWAPTAGQHRIRVRATDKSGYTQTDQMAPPAPDGATGWHTIRVTVT